MKKVLSLLLTAAMLLSVMATAAFAAEPSYGGKTVILYTGNIRGDVDVYPQVKAARAAYEAAGAEVFLVDAGNYLQGAAAANFDRGLSVYNLMDAAGYDVAAMGLAEFGYTDATTGYIYHGNYTRYYTQAELQNGAQAVSYSQNKDGSVTAERAAKEAAAFRTVASNVTAGGDAYAFEASAELTAKSGLKLAFYGLTDPAAAANVQDGFLSAAAPDAVSLPDADVVVCLSNAGVSGEGYGDILIDVPTGGGLAVGAYVIDNATKAVTKEEVVLKDSDQAVAALAAEAKTAAGTAVGTSQVILNGSDSVNWNGESNLGDLVTDALVWYAKNHVEGLDAGLPVVAIQNGGNCDNFIYTGDITQTDLLRALPFSPMGIGVLYVTGEQLLETLEAAAQQKDCPGFAQVSGLTYTVDQTADYDAGAAYGKFFEADSINRVAITAVDGKAFDPAATYALVCDNFLINGNDTYYTLKAAKEAGGATYLNNGNGVKVRDAVALYIKDELDGAVGSRYAQPQGRITVLQSAFSDVKSGDYFYDAVNWAVEQSVTMGTSADAFSPDGTVSRAQIITFLWRAAGSPEPAAGVNPFTDVPMDAYYAEAALWASEKGVLSGGNTAFAPDAEVSRAEVVTLLWKYAGQPASAGTNSFTDIPGGADYSAAVNWALENEITSGTSAATFSPDGTVSRAQIVTFLYRLLGE